MEEETQEERELGQTALFQPGQPHLQRSVEEAALNPFEPVLLLDRYALG